jgi:hypothetical protein
MRVPASRWLLSAAPHVRPHCPGRQPQQQQFRKGWQEIVRAPSSQCAQVMRCHPVHVPLSLKAVYMVPCCQKCTLMSSTDMDCLHGLGCLFDPVSSTPYLQPPWRSHVCQQGHTKGSKLRGNLGQQAMHKHRHEFKSQSTQYCW